MSTTLDYPLISCICITSNREEMLFKSIIAFAHQTYPSKELIVSYPYTEEPTKKLLDYLEENTSINIQRIERKESCSIGKARNHAVERANGYYICIWDDDDIHHQNRLTEQYNALDSYEKTFDASIIGQILLFQLFNQTAYLAFPSYWSCTLLCSKKLLLTHPFLDQNQFESKLILKHLSANSMASLIYQQPHLYTYVFHGRNLMKYTSFLYIVNQSSPVENEISVAIGNLVSQKLDIPY